MTAALSCADVRSGYGRIEVLPGISLSIEAGDIYALVGKNGAGKTTLLRTILGLLRPTAGTIKLFGDEIGGRSPHQIVLAGVALAPQEKAFFNELSVGENLRLGSLSLGQADFVRGRHGYFVGVKDPLADTLEVVIFRPRPRPRPR